MDQYLLDSTNKYIKIHDKYNINNTIIAKNLVKDFNLESDKPPGTIYNKFKYYVIFPGILVFFHFLRWHII